MGGVPADRQDDQRRPQVDAGGFDPGRGVTYPMREKEEAADYRYFPDPDLVPVTVTPEDVARVRAEMCETPISRRQRFQAEYQLSAYDTAVLVDQGRTVAEYFETVARSAGDGKQAANWVTQDVLRELNDRQLTIDTFPISAPVLADLLGRVHRKELTLKSAREVFGVLLESGEPASVEQIGQVIAEKGLAIVQDTGAIDAAIGQVIAANPKPVADFKSGKCRRLVLIGQVMKLVKGADPQGVRERLLEQLKSLP